jgi:hypothetical protein
MWEWVCTHVGVRVCGCVLVLFGFSRLDYVCVNCTCMMCIYCLCKRAALSPYVIGIGVYVRRLCGGSYSLLPLLKGSALRGASRKGTQAVNATPHIKN